MCSMSVHYIIQKTLNTNKCTKSFFVSYNTLLHVSTLLRHLQGETFCCRYTRLHYTVERECAGAVHCAAYGGVNSLWSRLVQAEVFNVFWSTRIRILEYKTCKSAHVTSHKTSISIFS
jgi:hypothetical protein